MTVPNNANVYLPATPTTPLALLITAITNAYPMIVTAQIPNLFILPSNPNTYVVGQTIRLSIPQPYGMQQANGLTGTILAISGLVFSLNINSTMFDPFATPSVFQEQPATFAPAGSSNLTYSNTNAALVPFQSASILGN
jgi:hypothetical protein